MLEYRNSTTGAYPLSDYDIRMANHNVSFPEVIDNTTANLFGFDLVFAVDQPTSPGQHAVEGDPIQLDDNTWQQTWTLVDDPVVPPPTVIDLGIFMNRFTADEQLLVQTAAGTIPAIALGFSIGLVVRSIDLENVLLAGWMDALVTAGCITSDRKTVILTP